MEATTRTRNERVYLSFPVSENLYTRDQIVKLITSKNDKEVSYWLQGHMYSDSDLRAADKVVIYLTGNQFKLQRHKISSGSRKELELAISLGKQVYLAYQSSLGIRIYATNINTNMIEGIPGTHLNFFQCSSISNVIDSSGSMNSNGDYNYIENPCTEIFKTSPLVKEVSKEDVQRYIGLSNIQKLDLRVLLLK